MGLQLEAVVPWGRSLPEYREFFALSPDDLGRRILDCASGPSGFNAEVMRQGGTVISCDPLYQFGAEEIRGRVRDTAATIASGLEANRDFYVWNAIASPSDLLRLRMDAMRCFLDDYPRGRSEGRYVVGALPMLPFASGAFDLVLCSHYLFLYSDKLSTSDHLSAIREMLRVGAEVRIYPLVANSGEVSPHLEPVMHAMAAEGRSVELVPVGYEFLRGANKMLVVHG